MLTQFFDQAECRRKRNMGATGRGSIEIEQAEPLPIDLGSSSQGEKAETPTSPGNSVD
jgi:hypothetical protein